MATQNSKELYVSFNPMLYRKAKQTILKTQEDLLHSTQHLNELKLVNQEKGKLKIQLHELFERVSKNLENLEKQMPKPKIPKTFQSKTEKSFKRTKLLSSIDLNEDEYYDKHQRIEKELLEIREKLRKLND